MKESDIERIHRAERHAAEVFEERHKAFRLIYDTLIMVEGKSEENVYSIICNNLRKLCKAGTVAFASFDKQTSLIKLEALSTDIKIVDSLSRELVREPISISSEVVANYKDNPIVECTKDNYCLVDFFPELFFRLDIFKDDSHYFRLSFVREEELVAVGVMQFRKGQKIRMRDMLDTYLTMASIILQKMNSVKALKESEERFRSLYENAVIGLYRTTPDGHILMANPAILRMLGYTSQTEIAQIDVEKEGYILGYSRSDFKKAIETKGQVKNYESAWKRNDGTTLYVSECAKVFHDESGNVVYYEGTVEDITERKLVEEALHQSEERLRSFMDSATDVFLILDSKLNIIEINRTGLKKYRKLGFGQDELIGRNLLTIEPELKRSGIYSSLKSIIKTGRSFVAEDFVSRIGKGEEYAILKAFKVGDGLGIIMTDITERKKSEEQLRSSEERFKLLFEYAPDGYFLCDLKGTFIDGNKVAEEMVGYKKEELIGKNFLKLKLLSPTQILKAAAILAIRPIEQYGGPYDFTLFRKDGSTVEIEIRSFLIKIRDKSMMLGIAHDITERKRAQKKLQESEEKYRTIFEQFIDLYYRTDMKGIITTLSPSVKVLTGYKPEELIGHSVREVFFNESVLDGFVEELEKSRYIENQELKIIKKKGEILNVSINAHIVFNEDRKPVAIEGVLHNITERKKAEEQIIASLQEKEVLLKEVHHRVKNNLQVISSLLYLQSRDITDDKTSELFKNSRNRVRSMALIHENLYQSSDLTRIDFSEYIRRLTRNLFGSYVVNTDLIELKLRIGQVFLDVDRAIPCGMIINELVSNCLKHAFQEGEDGKICIELNSNKDKGYTLVVSDNGVGFPEELDFRNTKSLGLRLVNMLVEQLGGTINVDGKLGTTFKIKFALE